MKPWEEYRSEQMPWEEYQNNYEPMTRGQLALASLKHDAEDVFYGVRRGLSGATLGASDWALRKMGVGDDYMKRREDEGLGGAAKIGGLAAEIGGNVLGAGGAITKGLSKMGFSDTGLLLRDAGLQGMIYGLTSSDKLDDAPINTAIGGVQGATLGMTMQAGLKTLGAASNYLRSDVQRGITYLRQRLGDEVTNAFIKKARNEGRTLAEVVNDEALDIAQAARQQTPKARYMMSDNIQNIRDVEGDKNRQFIDDMFGTKSGYDTVQGITEAEKLRAKPLYDQINEMGDLAEYEKQMDFDKNLFTNNSKYGSITQNGENNARQISENVNGRQVRLQQISEPIQQTNAAEAEKSSAIRDLVRFGQNSQRASRDGVFISRNDGARRSFVVNPQAEQFFDKASISKIGYKQLDNTPKGAQEFHNAITKAKQELGDLSEQVWVYKPEEYQKMKMFLSDDGLSGVSVKPDGDIVSVFVNPNAKLKDLVGGRSHGIMELAKQNGGNKLDAFDTFLPKLYSKHGFNEVSRDVWNEQFKPEKWNKEYFKKWNNGEPDVVYMKLYEPKSAVEAIVNDNFVLADAIKKVKQSYSMLKDLPDTDARVLLEARKLLSQQTASPNTTLAYQARQTLKEFDPVLNDATNSLVDRANKIFRDAKQFETAYDAAADVFKTNVKTPQFRASYNKMTDAEKESLRLGLKDELYKIIGNRENETMGWKRVVPAEVQNKIKMVLGAKEGEKLIAKANGEIRKMRNFNELISGSKTSEKQGLRDAYGLAIEATSHPTGAVGSVLKRVPWNDGRNMGIAKIMTDPRINLEAAFEESVNPTEGVNKLYDILYNMSPRKAGYESALAAYLAGTSLK